MYWRLLITILVELPVLRFFFPNESWRNVVIVGTLLSSITWPIALLLYQETDWSIYWIECGIMLAEGAMISVLRWDTKARAFLAGLTMNMVSFVCGKIWDQFL